MKKLILSTALSFWCAAGFAADGKSDPAEITGQTNFDTPAAMWVWTDRIVYSPGDPLTIRWTVKRNNDLYPYTIVAYRQNNQTGVKTYLPGNNTTPTDIFGNTVDQGFRPGLLPEANKAVLVGAGGSLIGSPASVPNEPGMHTIVVQIREYTGGRVVKSAYWKFGVVTSTVNVSGDITSNGTWRNNTLYRLRGIVSVRNNAVLTIEPGTIVMGEPGSQPPTVLLVTTAGRLIAEGTRSRPIIMTSTQPVGSRNRGDWGGLVMLGDAPINDPGGELTIEGLPELPETRYGGNVPTHNCGSLRYVRVEYAGALLRPNEETNSITWGGCGSATRGEYLQAHYGLDDAFEWFGGSNDAKYLVGTYTADDYIDGQIGWTGRVQHGVMVANADRSNRGIEMDNYERDFAARPLGRASVYNVSFVGENGTFFDEADSPCLYFRRGAAGTYGNLLCFNWGTRGFGGASADTAAGSVIQTNITNNDFTANGILLWDNGARAATVRPNTVQGQVLENFQAFAGVASRQFLIANPLLRRPLERSDPDFRAQVGSPVWRANWIQPPDDGFFDQWATWIGGFGDIDWTQEWTTFHQEQDLRP